MTLFIDIQNADETFNESWKAVEELLLVFKNASANLMRNKQEKNDSVATVCTSVAIWNQFTSRFNLHSEWKLSGARGDILSAVAHFSHRESLMVSSKFLISDSLSTPGSYPLKFHFAYSWEPRDWLSVEITSVGLNKSNEFSPSWRVLNGIE